jgi:hypothetical protein
MDRDQGREFHVNPLAELEVQRALALARARESYPAVPRETLLGYCEAAWDVALKADPRGRDLQGSFDRALLIIAWTQRRSGGRVPLRDLIDQTVPRVALQPFFAEPPEPPEPESRPEAADRLEPAPARRVERPAPARRSLVRVPFTSPIPVGAAVAAGLVGVAVLSETEVLPIAPLQPAGNDKADTGDDVATRDGGARKHQSGSGAQSGSGESGAMISGLLPQGLGEAAQQITPAPAPESTLGRSVTAEDIFGGGEQRATQAAAKAAPAKPDAPARAPDPAPSIQVAAAPEPAPAPDPAPVVDALPAPEPVVRIEMEPAEMILEVSAPGRWHDGSPSPDTDEEESAPDVEAPDEPESDRDHDHGYGTDEESFDRLTDAIFDDADEEDADEYSDQDGDEYGDEYGDEDSDRDSYGEEAPVVPAPVTPAPATPVTPTAPAPAPTAPATGANPPAPSPSAPAPAPVPSAPAPAPAAPAAPAPAPAAPAPAPAAPAPAPAAPAPAPAAPAPAPAAPAPAPAAPAPAAPAPTTPPA